MTETSTHVDGETCTNDRGLRATLLSRWTALDRGWKAALFGVLLVAVQFIPVVPL
ncbi:hypothetical protein [Halococcus sp. AFM35]|uniref:hypothetical protein n=1 Tax=Halococcus sp. AFM35 TaxID=3421653 RepID=UPI003EBECD35